MKQILKPQQFELLRYLVGKRCPEISDRVVSPDISGLLQGERLVMIDAISDELMESGLDKNYEPTQKGLQLEELLDIVNRPNLQK